MRTSTSSAKLKAFIDREAKRLGFDCVAVALPGAVPEAASRLAKAVADGQPAIGITDHGNMYGTLEFYKECRAQGIKPIIGTEAYMAHDHRSERPARRGRLDDSEGDVPKVSCVSPAMTDWMAGAPPL